MCLFSNHIYWVHSLCISLPDFKYVGDSTHGLGRQILDCPWVYQAQKLQRKVRISSFWMTTLLQLSRLNFLCSFLWFPTPQVSVLQPIKSVPCILQNVILFFNLPPQFLILQKCNFCYSIYIWVTLWATQRFVFDSKFYACFFAIYQVVRWGRSVYYNIQKFIQFQLTVNVVALTINLVAAISSGKVPLNAVQVLENLNCEPNGFTLIIWCSSIVEIA